MTYLSNILLLAVLLILYRLRPRQPKLITPLMLALVVISLFSGYRQMRSDREKGIRTSTSFISAATAVMGNTLKEALPTGGHILAIHPSTQYAVEWETSIDFQKRGFERTLDKRKHRITWHELDAVADASLETGVISPDTFEDILQNYSGVDAVVLLQVVVEPGWDQRKLHQPLYVYMVGAPKLDAVYKQIKAGAVNGAIVSKNNVDWRIHPSPNMTDQEIFDIRFELLTANTL